MPIQGDVKNLYSDREKTRALFPTTKVSAVSDDNGVGLDALMENLLYSGIEVPEASSVPLDADTLEGHPASDFATPSFVTSEIAKAQLSGGSGGDIDLSGFATKDDVNNAVRAIDYPVDSVNGKTGAVQLSASEVGAAPAGFGLGEEVKFVNNIDNLLVPGQYKFYNNGNPLIDGVADTKSCNVEVISSGAGCIHRISSHISGYCAERMHNGTTWGEWIRCDAGAFAPAGYGLGDMLAEQPIIADAHEIWKTGWYRVHPSVTANAPVSGVLRAEVYAYRYVTLTLYTNEYLSNDTTILRQCLVDGVWQDWEFYNPPMALGVEYRTTKRYNGKAVYTKLLNLGNLPNAGQVAFSIASGIDRFIYAETTLKTGSGSGDVVNSDAVTIYFGHNHPGSTNNSSWVDVITKTDVSEYTAELMVEYTKV